QRASDEITNILRDSVSGDTAFSAFMLGFTKKPLEEIQPSAVESELYAPLPEELPIESTPAASWRPSLPSLPSLPKINIKLPSIKFAWMSRWKLPYFQNLSRAGKFFFISFAVFLLLFLVNLGFYAARLHSKRAESRADQLIVTINEGLAQTQSALIYKDENQAIEQLNKAIADLQELTSINPDKASELSPKVEQMKTVINKINTIAEPKLFVQLEHHPLYMYSSPVGMLFSNEDSNSLSLFSNNTLTDYFLLNSVKSPIVSIGYFAPAGVLVATKDQIYRIDQSLKQFDPLIDMTDANLKSIKSANSALYVLTAAKVTKTSTKYQTQTSITGEFASARDFGVDKDFYILYPDKIIKYVSGNAQAFPLPNMSENMTNADKIFVGSNLYILEANKKRIIVLNKNGVLVNQIYFPSAQNITDFHIDEQTRSLYILDDNQVYKATI
ncbi:MAG: 6-bladed beta-propeller, partial [Candidatus Doudnabacteria bacterium]|nr:6-bladed beta-propeller [Candidatus Doudnabacteria bacterium]